MICMLDMQNSDKLLSLTELKEWIHNNVCLLSIHILIVQKTAVTLLIFKLMP